jgi:hypothetical protein
MPAQPTKTIEAYARAIRRIGSYFKHDINDLSQQQLADYFTDLLSTHSWSAVKLDLYGLKFYYAYVIDKPWVNVDLIKPPQGAAPTRYRYCRGGWAFYFTAYSLGLRLGEGLRQCTGASGRSRFVWMLCWALGVSCGCNWRQCGAGAREKDRFVSWALTVNTCVGN